MAKGTAEYFLNFPMLNYNGFAATNIMARSVIASKFMENAELFYSYTVKDGETAETVAFNSYGNSNYVWVIRLFNNNLDPYYSWPLSQEEFNNVINQKYGSWENAAQQIQYYQNNWASDDSIINLNGYDSLPDYERKYWKPVIRSGNYVYQYKRAESDTIISTNQILQIPVSNSNAFTIDEIVTQNSATGFVSFSNSSMLTLRHIIGAFNNTDIMIGSSSGVNTVPTGFINQTFVIPTGEAHYFSPVFSLDVELENNQVRSNIKILKEDFLQSVVQSFATEMQS